jgi:hypothetical protein
MSITAGGKVAEKPAKPVGLTDIALTTQRIVEGLREFAEMGRALNRSKLKRRAVVLLLRDLTGVGVKEIELVLNALPEMEQFVKS